MLASSMRQAARDYASTDWPVFPLLPIVADRCACGGTDCAGKHPASKGWQRTIASGQAAESVWADHHGVRGIGLACGPRARVWGLDVDPRHGGDRTLRELQKQHGPLPRTITSRTGSGGWRRWRMTRSFGCRSADLAKHAQRPGSQRGRGLVVGGLGAFRSVRSERPERDTGCLRRDATPLAADPLVDILWTSPRKALRGGRFRTRIEVPLLSWTDP
jgi:hypothetical protein